MPFATIWMVLESIMLSEISQRPTLYGITYMWNLKEKKKRRRKRKESKTLFHRNRIKWKLPRVGGRDKWKDVGQRAQTFSYKLNKF